MAGRRRSSSKRLIPRRTARRARRHFVGPPVDEASTYAKGGVAYFDTKRSAYAPGFIQFSDKDTSSGAAWGFGASYPVWCNLEERFRVSGATVDLIGTGLAWKF